MRDRLARLLIVAMLGGFFVPVAATAEVEASVIPRFTEETATAGIDSVFAGDWEYMVGGGVATLDCNGNGYPDMFLSGGSAPARLYRNDSPQGGALRFTPVTSGLEVEGVLGAYPLDIDGDGIGDLILLRVGENIVMRGLGDCRFENANADWGFDGGDAWSTALAAMWEAGADWPTVAIGNYIDRTEDAFPWGSCTDNWLHRPGPGGFTPPLTLQPGHCALSMLFTDWNRSGTPSLRVSNDREYYKGGQEQLWHVAPDAAPVLYTQEEGWQPLRIWGMGIAAHDLTLDGFPEYFLTSMADNKLQKLAVPVDGADVRPVYDDVAFAAGVTAHRPFTGDDLRPSTAWHAQFADVNNDGYVDLFVAKGNVDAMPDFAQGDPNNLLLQRPDGTFAEAGDVAGVASMATARGAALVDFNLNGLLDLVVVNRRESAQVWRNISPVHGRWVQIGLVRPGANRDAINAWIELRRDDDVLRREVTVGGGHASGQRGWHHFGIGGQDMTEARVIWPDGTAGAWETLAADGFYIMRPDAPAARWSAPRNPDSD